MPRLRSTIAVLASVPLLLAAMAPAVLAQDEDQKRFGDNPNVGTWVIDAEVDDPDNALSLTTLNADGTLRDRTADGTGAGVWEPSGEDGVESTILYQVVDPEGTFFGFVTVRTSGEVSEDGRTTGGTYTVEFPDGLPAGMFPPAGEYGPAEFTGTKVAVESMGETVGPWPLPPPGASAGAAAQTDTEEADPLAPAKVTGTIGGGDVVAEPTETLVDGVLEGRGLVVEGETIETDDPRLTGSITRALNANIHKVSDFVDVLALAGAVRIENEAGSWSGQVTGLIHQGGGIPPDEATNLAAVVLSGEGAYEGLSAYLFIDATEDQIAVEGVIFAGELPPFPELPAAE